jgi:dGTPase
VEFYHSGDYARVVGIPDSGSPEPYRSPFRRDFARIVHTPAFRRLQRKTQLFPGDESDFFRNRLTHSLEVAQIAKSIAIRLNYLIREKCGGDAGAIDTDLVELVALAHDMGHWPAPGSEDTELGVFMGPEVSHGETKVYAGVQA